MTPASASALAEGLWDDPLEADDLAMLFDSFDADLDTELTLLCSFLGGGFRV